MATHSSVLAWRIPGTAEPSGLPSMESHRVRHDWSNLAAAAAVEELSLFFFCIIVYYKILNIVPSAIQWDLVIFFIYSCFYPLGASLVAEMVKNLPAVWETQVWSLAKGTSYPVQYSCLDHSMDRWAWVGGTVQGAAKSQKQLSD